MKVLQQNLKYKNKRIQTFNEKTKVLIHIHGAWNSDKYTCTLVWSTLEFICYPCTSIEKLSVSVHFHSVRCILISLLSSPGWGCWAMFGGYGCWGGGYCCGGLFGMKLGSLSGYAPASPPPADVGGGPLRIPPMNGMLANLPPRPPPPPLPSVPPLFLWSCTSCGRLLDFCLPI